MQTANRVAINTIIQYVKLIVNVLVGLISVRILLNALGADDYGIYDVVGGVIALLAFVNSSLSQSSIRFLSVSIGKSDVNDTRSVFNNCFWVHLLVSICVVIICLPFPAQFSAMPFNAQLFASVPPDVK